MNKIFTLILLGAITFCASAQKKPVDSETQPFGKVDNADLELKACDFEKDANAEVLFAKGDAYFGADVLSITEEVHKRIKIFNDNGKKEANIRILYVSGHHLEYIRGLEAQTINLVDGKAEITKVDKKLLYNKAVDNYFSEITFTFPNVKPGSVIEYKYIRGANFFADFPEWDFQENIPVRYSEFRTAIPDIFYFRAHPHIEQPLIKDVRSSEGRSMQSFSYNLETEVRAMSNIHSLPDEPYMSSFHDNVQAIRFQLVSIKPIGGFVHSYSDTWAKVGGGLIDNEDFGGQLKRKLNGEEIIISKAKTIKANDEKIAYIFKEVKNAMKWNGQDHWYTYDGTYRAWENKTGNSTEINLILYHLLKQSGVEAYPMVVSTRKHGRVDPFHTSIDQFNRGVVYIPIDSNKNYVLDATGKYNMYNETPAELLNSTGLLIDKAKDEYDMITLEKHDPVRQIIFLTAEVKPAGKLEGNVQISSSSYNKIFAVERYKKDGEKKYTDFLSNDDNNLKITSLKLENMEVDSLPLMQKADFNMELTGSDGNYIYLNPNLFTPLKTNPFLSESRFTDIDFGYAQNVFLNGIFKTPAGYKTDALPNNITIVMPDKSFSFKRFIAEQDGNIVIRYNISFNVAEYPRENYADMQVFFKKMHELLNEPIVFKKS